MRLAGKTILLTGATGGIGQAIAKELAAAGARLLLVGRNEVLLQALVSQLAQQPTAVGHRTVVADLTTSAGCKTVQAAVQAAGVLDGVINNAGISQFALLPEQDFASQLMLNLLAPMQLTQLLLPELIARDEALIVNIGSAFGSIGHAGYSGYCASKFGLRGFTEALRRELADSKVQVLYFAPRATDTGINSPAVVAMNKALGNQTDSPALVAAQLREQISRDQARRYVGWPEKLFVRLNALLPSLVDKALAGKLTLIRRFAGQR